MAFDLTQRAFENLRENPVSKGWIGVDLDGTLAKYDGWVGVDHIGDPVPLMVSRVKIWLQQGHDVRIFTARVSGFKRDQEQIERAYKAIEEWCIKHIGQKLIITNEKDLNMIELYDDRAVQVEANTGLIVGYSTRGNV
jgi:hypothetical protein